MRVKSIAWIASLLSCLLIFSCGSKKTASEVTEDIVDVEVSVTEDVCVGEENTHEEAKQEVHIAVDLGLPSGIKWATTNVGAFSPSDYGEYYALGEIKTNSDYTSSGNPNIRNMIKNHTNETIEGNPLYDASTANWGSNWRLPYNKEWYELESECKWTWTNLDGINGYKVTGPNGNSIFLPAGGYKGDHGTETVSENVDLYYWEAPNKPISGYENTFWVFYKSSGGYSETKDTSYCYGFLIRPITYASFEELGIEGGSEANIDDTVKPSVSGSIANHDYVDLGLPSGTKWATKNIGAQNLYDFGTLYQWGATHPGEYFGSIDGSTLGKDDICKNISGKENYDVARKNWGESWRLPSAEELAELVNLCDWTVLRHDNASYYLAIGPNKNCLIIPLGGKGIWGSVPESRSTAYYMGTYGNSENVKGQPSPIITYDKQNILRNIRPVSD